MESSINKNKAFTLVETLVSITLFGMVSLILINVFMTSIKTQSRILFSQELIEQSSYALEYMGTKIRMATADQLGTCVGASNVSYVTGDNSITFLAHDPVNDEYLCRKFFLENQSIKEVVSIDKTSANFGSSSIITSPSFVVDKLNFVATQPSSTQPRVTIMIEASKIEQGEVVTSKITVQTTISKRELQLN